MFIEHSVHRALWSVVVMENPSFPGCCWLWLPSKQNIGLIPGSHTKVNCSLY